MENFHLLRMLGHLQSNLREKVMRIFAEIDADQAFNTQLQRAKSEIESLDKASSTQVDDETYILRILSQVRIDPIHFKFNDVYISTYEKMIPSEQHPGHNFFLEAGKSYKRQIVKYHLPFEGDSVLLRCIPNPGIMWSINVDLNGNEISFDIVNWSGDAEDIKREANDILKTIHDQWDNLSKQVNAFNTSAQEQIMRMLSGWKAKIKKDNDFVAALGLPVKQMQHSKTSSISVSQGNKLSKTTKAPDKKSSKTWDIFISHASEDKDAFVRELANELTAKGLKVWYDEFTLTIGDSLRRSIDQGLANSQYGIVVLSHNFFSKEWPQRELDGLVAKEISSGKLILPIWHDVTKDDVARFSPILADRLAVTSDRGMNNIIKEIMAAIEKKSV